MGWEPIDAIPDIPYGTVASLRLKNGHVVLATWEYRGRRCAWYTRDGRSFALWQPAAYRIEATGMGIRKPA